MGIGWACILGPATVAGLSSMPDSLGAVVMGSAWTMHNIGGAIGLGVGVVIYHVFATESFIAGYQSAMWLLVTSSFTALAVVFLGMKGQK